MLNARTYIRHLSPSKHHRHKNLTFTNEGERIPLERLSRFIISAMFHYMCLKNVKVVRILASKSPRNGYRGWRNRPLSKKLLALWEKFCAHRVRIILPRLGIVRQNMSKEDKFFCGLLAVLGIIFLLFGNVEGVAWLKYLGVGLDALAAATAVAAKIINR